MRWCKRLLWIALGALLCGLARPGAALTFTWDASPSPEVTGYRLHYGAVSGTYTAQQTVGNVLTMLVDDTLFPPGETWYFAATALDVDGNESPYSNEVAHAFPSQGGGGASGDLVASYAANEGTGTTVADGTGNSHTGTLLNGATWAAGKYGQAIALDGSNDALRIADAAPLDLTSAGSVLLWAWLDTLGRWQALVSKGTLDSYPSQNYAMEVSTTNRIECVLGTGSTYQMVASPTALAANQWVHIACTWNGTTLALYVNGTLVVSAAQTVTPVANSAPLEFGRFSSSVDHLDGRVDELRIYKIALAAADIVTAMQTPLGDGAVPPQVTGVQVEFLP